MQFLHQTRYGHVGEMHTAKPIMAMSGGHIYDIKDGRPDLAKPLYKITGNQVYATQFHPAGASNHAIFEIRGDKVHTTAHHIAHDPTKPAFEIKGMMT